MRHGLTVFPPAVLLFLTTVLPTASAAGPGARPAPTPLPDARLGIRTAPILLLSRPDVRADLGLSPTLSGEAERALSDLYVRAAALRGERGVQAVAGRRAVDEAQRAWFETHLTPDQRSRLVQIDLQWEGPSSLVSRAVVADTLELTPDQRAALLQAVAARNAARGRQTSSQADEQALARRSLALLSEPQRERWRAMLGRPFVPRLAAAQAARSSVRR